MANVGLDIRALKKTYDRKTFVLDDINLSVAPGDFVVLVGPSGCGKSTLLRTIAGLESATAGEIRIGERIVTDLHPSERGVAMVFQDYALYPHMTVRENLSFGLRMKGVARATIRERVAEVAELLQITPLLDRKPAKLSGGQRQRVAIGRALVKKPPLFLFDEPLSNLDAQLRSQTRIELADLHQRLGATTVYVTHDQVEAMTLATQIVILNRGKIQQVGAPLEVYENPANAFVAGFLGSPSMNLMEGDLYHDGERRSFAFGPDLLDLTKAPTPGPGRYLLGIRPEHIGVSLDGQRTGVDDVPISARVQIVEPLGHESLVIVETGKKQSLTLRTADPEIMRALRPGRAAKVLLNTRKFHWFDPRHDGRRV